MKQGTLLIILNYIPRKYTLLTPTILALSPTAQRELMEHEHHQRLIAQGADPSLSAAHDQHGDAFSIYSDLTHMTSGRVNSTRSKIFFGSTASTESTICPENQPDNYQDALTEEDMADYETLERCQYNQGDEVLTAHDGSDDPLTCKS